MYMHNLIFLIVFLQIRMGMTKEGINAEKCKKLGEALVLQQLDYCSVIWSNTTVSS